MIVAELKRNPAWMESVLRHRRSAESSARYRQMDTTQVALLYLETMGVVGLPGTAQARCERARSVEHQQVGPRPVAAIENAGTGDGATSALLQKLGLPSLAPR